MGRQVQFQRLLWLGATLALAFAALGLRLVWLQVVRHEELVRIANENAEFADLLEPRRGDILDVKGNPLATSQPVKTVCANPSLLGNRSAEVARALAPVLQKSEAELAQRLAPRVHLDEKGMARTNLFVVLKRRVPLETWARVQGVMSNLVFVPDEQKLPRAERAFYRDLRRKAVFAKEEQIRKYPGQTLASHILGYAASEDRMVNDTWTSEIVGRDGIELVLNDKLRGVRGWRLSEADRQRRELVTRRVEDVEPLDGLNVVLTIDSVIQHMVETALAEAMERHLPNNLSGIVVRPRTGEILAMATLPNFDSNAYGSAPPDARRNQAIAAIAEPGSTFKIVVVSGALNDGAVKLMDAFDCEHGRFHYAGRVLHDHEPYGVLSVEQIITKSSNIGAAKIGIKLGPHRLHNYITEFGFGSRTGIPLPGEAGGIVHPVKDWSKVSIAQIPMGHGVAVTRLQMVMAMSAIANKGVLMRPMLVDRLEDKRNVVAKYSPQRLRQVMSESTARKMVQALKTVVSAEGTAPKAALPHHAVAGKTGTAQKVENGVYVRKYFSSFIGFFPADNPEVCIGVMMDDPKQGYYGGQTAAPIFKQIAEGVARYLGIPSDDGELPSTPDSIAAPSDSRPVKTVAARGLPNPQP
jgi:cell division protein FtsI/penicillin-binding protein 2